MRPSPSRRPPSDRRGSGRSTRSSQGSDSQGDNARGRLRKQILSLDRYEASSLDKNAFDIFKRKMGNCGDYILEILGENERPLLPKSPLEIFWFSQLTTGLRLSIPPFFIRIAQLYNMPLNQLNPATVRKLPFSHDS